MKKIIYELNEIPKKLFDFYSSAFPNSAFAKLKKNANYTCQACGLNYEKVYGDYSKKKDFIEAHHIEPKFKAKEKAEIDKKLKRSAKDFAMLCANCHRKEHYVAPVTPLASNQAKE